MVAPSPSSGPAGGAGISPASPEDDSADRALLVGASPEIVSLTEPLRRHLPGFRWTTRSSYLEGIVEAARGVYRAVFALPDPALPRLGDAVAGLREAAGPDARLVLLCPPEREPLARSVLETGADDYVLLPVERNELYRAMGWHSLEPSAGGGDLAADELSQLTDVIRGLADRPGVVLQRAAEMVRSAIGAKAAWIVTEGTRVAVGRAEGNPVLSATLRVADRSVGHIGVSLREDGRPYAPAEAERLRQYAALLAAVLEAADAQRRWQQAARTDECSGLPNRRYLCERLDEILAEAGRRRLQVSVLVFDVDDFKSFNDAFGHEVGDTVIRVVGETFRRHCREQDVVARYGGDEFAVVFWDPHGPRVAGSQPPDSALRVLDRVREALAQAPIEGLGAGGAKVTISGGLATFPWDGRTRAELLKKADEALLQAKRAGKNRVYTLGRTHRDRS